jgi:predicted transcriptional regulator
MQMKAPPSLYLQSPQLNQLNLLREVSANAHITQAELASRCYLSVAMVNNYMKELCECGFLEYHRKTIKSVTYHLTSAGAQHLESLQAKLVDEMVSMFVAAKEHIRIRIMNQTSTALQRVVLYGSGPLAQLAFHALELSNVCVLGVCDDNPTMIGRDFCGREVVSPSQIRFIAPDAVIVADSLRTDELYRNLSSLSNRGIKIIYLNQPSQPPSEYSIAVNDSSRPKSYSDYSQKPSKELELLMTALGEKMKE